MAKNNHMKYKKVFGQHRMQDSPIFNWHVHSHQKNTRHKIHSLKMTTQTTLLNT